MECPHCGARVPRGAKACPECGSDDETGWADGETVEYESLDLPDAYDPDRWEDEAQRDAARRIGMRAIVAIIAVLAAILAICVWRGI